MLLIGREVPREVHGDGRFVLREFTPAYLRTYEEGRLREKVEEALEALRDCTLCPRDCHVNRLENRFAVCKVGRYARVSAFFPHFGEEDVLRGWRGSGTIFFSWCNLRCVFCLHPDTRIATDQGLVRIADLFEQASGEPNGYEEWVRFVHGKIRVLTRTGTWAPIAKVFRHRFAGYLIRIKPFNCPPILLTPNHEVFAIPKEGAKEPIKVRAERLTKDMYLLVPRRILQLPGTQLDVQGLLSTGEPALQTSRSHRYTAEGLVSLSSPLREWSRDTTVTFEVGEAHANPKTERPRLRWKATEEYFLVPIHRIERVPYDGPVFNLEVDDPDHSYTASFVAVGNCQNFETSQIGEGIDVTPRELAAMMLRLQELGCHNINFVTPEHVVPQILEALPYAIEGGLRLPIVYNTSAYDSLHSIRLMDGVVDIYMPDFKVWDRERARRYLLAPDYPDAARRVISAMHAQVGDLVVNEEGLALRGLIVRHLVMPGMLDDTREILHWLGQLSRDTYVNVMDQYYPAWKAKTEPKYGDINRRIFPEELEQAYRYAREAGLWRLDRRWRRIPGLLWL
jgi:uncharacterized Fe-S radical SAM superfamily protein PflX